MKLMYLNLCFVSILVLFYSDADLYCIDIKVLRPI